MNATDQPGFWERLRCGRTRFRWKQPGAFVRLRFVEELKDIWRVPRLRLMAALAPLCPFLVGLWQALTDTPPGRSVDWIRAFAWGLFLAYSVIVLCSLWLGVLVGVGMAFPTVACGERGLRFMTSFGPEFCAWKTCQASVIVHQSRYAVLAIRQKNGAPVLLGIPAHVPLDELQAFLLTRGLEPWVDADAVPPHFLAAT